MIGRSFPKPQDDLDQKLLSDIETYGVFIMNVKAQGVMPGFSYSIGLWHTHKHPEIILIGLKPELSHSIINQVNRRLKDGDNPIETSQLYGGFLEGFDVRFEEVPGRHFKGLVGYNLWLYKGKGFPLLQCVWPSTKGPFPDEDAASTWFKKWQPVLKTLKRYEPSFLDPNLGVFCCSHVGSGERPVRYVRHEHDGDWQFLCGESDHEEEDDDTSNMKHLQVHHLTDMNASLNQLADLAHGREAERHSTYSAWERRRIDGEDDTPCSDVKNS